MPDLPDTLPMPQDTECLSAKFCRWSLKDPIDKRTKKLDAFKKIGIRTDWILRHLEAEGSKQSLRMSDIAYTVYICVLHFSRTLLRCQVRQVPHQFLDQALEKGHSQKGLHTLKFA